MVEVFRKGTVHKYTVIADDVEQISYQVYNIENTQEQILRLQQAKEFFDSLKDDIPTSV